MNERIVTFRVLMLDLGLMGFLPVAITRCDPEDTCFFAIFAKEDLSEPLRNAVLNEGGSLVQKALQGSESLNYGSKRNSN